MQSFVYNAVKTIHQSSVFATVHCSLGNDLFLRNNQCARRKMIINCMEKNV